jgi:intracellular septation protein
MKFLFDFFPIMLFFAFYKYLGIFPATAAAIITTLMQLIWVRYKTGKYQKTLLISFLSILILGGTSILLQDEMFIKWKTTCVYWLLALAFLFSRLFSKKTFIEQLVQQSISLPRKIWQQLNIAWVVFFTLMGLLNLFVVYNFDTDTWVNFKFFGTFGLTLVFILGQGIYMTKHIPKENRSENI